MDSKLQFYNHKFVPVADYIFLVECLFIRVSSIKSNVFPFSQLTEWQQTEMYENSVETKC